MLELRSDGTRAWAGDAESGEKLEKACIGWRSPLPAGEGAGALFLTPEEALYALLFQNGHCMDAKGAELGFAALAARFAKSDPRLAVAFTAYRDWRDRGLVARRETGAERGTAVPPKAYPAKPAALPAGLALHWQNGLATAEGPAAERAFAEQWFGQQGVYKQQARSGLVTFDWLETAFLAKHAGAAVTDPAGKRLGAEDVVHAARQEYGRQLFEVYEDWRAQGFVVKTGFKFGTHFRIYFPGAKPMSADAGAGAAKKPASGPESAWAHSKHVLHVFPKEQRLLVSEWARAVRVAHGVRKTFLLAIPELTEKDRAEVPAAFVAWRRKKKGGDWVRETPADPARHLLVPIGEDEKIGGLELATLLRAASSRGLELLLAIVDRETAVTHYALKQVQLPGSAFAYYEIEWLKP